MTHHFSQGHQLEPLGELQLFLFVSSFLGPCPLPVMSLSKQFSSSTLLAGVDAVNRQPASFLASRSDAELEAELAAACRLEGFPTNQINLTKRKGFLGDTTVKGHQLLNCVSHQPPDFEKGMMFPK